MSAGRMRRVDEAVREVLSDAISQGLKDPRIGFVTVTDVKTSTDLRHARVYVSVLGGEVEREEAFQGLTSAAGFLQSQVGSELRMKRTPTLEFVHDPSIEHGMRMERLISDVVPDERAE